jgi:glyoxylase-like metal-dependent hydrolase (beta-lactamase superfamily II)
VVAGGALSHDVPSTQSGLLLVHPGGAWLVDGGMSADFGAHLREIPGLAGAVVRASAKDWVRVALPADALRAVGYAPSDLAGAIVTHGHFDHLGGLLELPGVPIYAPEAELAAARAAVAGEKSLLVPSEAEGLLARGRPIPFDGPAVGPWPRSWDIYGDGSALVVPMPDVLVLPAHDRRQWDALFGTDTCLG